MQTDFTDNCHEFYYQLSRILLTIVTDFTENTLKFCNTRLFFLGLPLPQNPRDVNF